MIDLKEFQDTLTTMSTRSKAFQLVKTEMLNRGHWKALKRGKPIKTNLSKRQSTDVSIHLQNSQQVRDENAYSDWGA
jgi:hypothetical protein